MALACFRMPALCVETQRNRSLEEGVQRCSHPDYLSIPMLVHLPVNIGVQNAP